MIQADSFNGLNGLGSYLPASKDANKKAEYARELRIQMEQNRSDRDQKRRENQHFMGSAVQARYPSDPTRNLPITLGDGVREMLNGQRMNFQGGDLRAAKAGVLERPGMPRNLEDPGERKRQYGAELRAQAYSDTYSEIHFGTASFFHNPFALGR
jgi:hypothetical protein